MLYFALLVCFHIYCSSVLSSFPFYFLFMVDHSRSASTAKMYPEMHKSAEFNVIFSFIILYCLFESIDRKKTVNSYAVK